MLEVADYAKKLEEQVIVQQLVIEKMREALKIGLREIDSSSEPFVHDNFADHRMAEAIELQPSLDLLEAERQRVRGECAKAME